MIRIDTIIDNVVVINLSRRKDRLEAFESQISQLNWPFGQYQVVRAVDGRLIEPPKWWKQGRGAWGCLRSHIRVIEDAIMEKRPVLLVLEDDARFSHDFSEGVEKFLENIPDDWDQVYLGGQHLVGREGAPQLVAEGVVQAFNVNRTHAYLIKNSFMLTVYKWLSDYVEHAKNPKHHVDHRLGVLHERRTFNIYAPVKWLAGQDHTYSDVKCKDMPVRWWNERNKMNVSQMKFAAVIGLHRSGSSCLAGVLHKLGVHMGDRLVGHEKTGGFEGAGLASLCEKAYPFPRTKCRLPREVVKNKLAEHIEYVSKSAVNKGKPMAGGKYPTLCAMGELLEEICGERLAVVHINRPLDASVRSMKTRSAKCTGWLHINNEASQKVQEWLWNEKNQFLKRHKHLTIEYQDLLDNPREQIGRLIEYLSINPSEEQIESAVRHIQPVLNKHGA